jgi:hypothetical protein
MINTEHVSEDKFLFNNLPSKIKHNLEVAYTCTETEGCLGEHNQIALGLVYLDCITTRMLPRSFIRNWNIYCLEKEILDHIKPDKIKIKFFKQEISSGTYSIIQIPKTENLVIISKLTNTMLSLPQIFSITML